MEFINEKLKKLLTQKNLYRLFFYQEKETEISSQKY